MNLSELIKEPPPTHKIKRNSIWYHPKTDGDYLVLGLIKCSTNSRPGEVSVLYVSLSTGEEHYREVSEFLDGRFTLRRF